MVNEVNRSASSALTQLPQLKKTIVVITVCYD